MGRSHQSRGGGNKVEEAPRGEEPQQCGREHKGGGGARKLESEAQRVNFEGAKYGTVNPPPTYSML